MAGTDWASLINAAYKKLTQGYASADQATATQNSNTRRTLTGLADVNKQNKMNTAISAVDRGMNRSGAYIQQQGNVAKDYSNQVDLTNRNNAAALARIAQQKLAARSSYDEAMANIKKGQQAEVMQRIAQLPKGIDFAALRRMSGGK